MTILKQIEIGDPVFVKEVGLFGVVSEVEMLPAAPLVNVHIDDEFLDGWTHRTQHPVSMGDIRILVTDVRETVPEDVVAVGGSSDGRRAAEIAGELAACRKKYQQLAERNVETVKEWDRLVQENRELIDQKEDQIRVRANLLAQIDQMERNQVANRSSRVLDLEEQVIDLARENKQLQLGNNEILKECGVLKRQAAETWQECLQQTERAELLAQQNERLQQVTESWRIEFESLGQAFAGAQNYQVILAFGQRFFVYEHSCNGATSICFLELPGDGQ
jgi:hypothetical protein